MPQTRHFVPFPSLKNDIGTAVGRLLGRRWLRLPTAIGLCGAVALVAIWVATFVFVAYVRREALANATHQAESTARAMEQHTVAAFDAIDQTLMDFAAAWMRDPWGAEFRSVVDQSLIARQLALDVGMTDETGTLRYSKAQRITPPVSLADREYIRIHLDRAFPDVMYVGTPVVGRLSGRTLVPVSRRVFKPDGSLAGVLVFALDPRAISKFYASIDNGNLSSAALVGTDGVVRARASNEDQAIGRDFSRGVLFRDLIPRQKTGTYISRGIRGGIERLHAYRVSSAYPLVTISGIATTEIFRHYRSIRVVIFAAAALLSATVLGAIVAILVALRVRVERELARLNAERQLRQAHKMEAIGQLTGGIAHDFNNLLGVVIGNLDLLDNDLREHPAQRKLAKSALDAAERGASLTHRLLAFARRQTLLPEIVDANRLIGEMIDILRSSLGKKIAIEPEYDFRLWPCRVDPGQLEAAILDLALNARDAMPNGGTLRIKTENARLAVARPAVGEKIPPGDYATIVVADDGTGMSADVVARSFEPFFTTKEIGKGTGLGLSMVYGFVRQSGGQVAVESRPGSGTRITIYLPRIVAVPSTRLALSRLHRRAYADRAALKALDGAGAPRHNGRGPNRAGGRG